MSDQWIFTKVKSELLAAEGVPSAAINVDVKKGVVVLKGVVETPLQKTRALEAARSVKGVQRVVDKLHVER